MLSLREEIEFVELSDHTLRASICKPVKYIVQDNGCWECVSHKSNHGGYIRLRRKNKDVYLHRLVYEKFVAKIPSGLIILHACDNPACINPSHLSVGTVRDNNQDKVNKGRQPRGEAVKSAKITEDDVRAIRKDARPNHIVGAEYGIANRTVCDIKNRVKWRHVTD